MLFSFLWVVHRKSKKEVVDYFTSWHDRVRTELIFERFLAPKGAQEVSICDCSYHWSLKYFSSFVCLSSSQEFCSACSKWRPCIWRHLCLQYIYDSPNMIVLLDSFYWLNSDISFIHLRLQRVFTSTLGMYLTHCKTFTLKLDINMVFFMNVSHCSTHEQRRVTSKTLKQTA